MGELAHQSAEQNTQLSIRDPFIFEFLGLEPAEVMSESHLEQQLIEKLQNFLLQLKLERFSHENLGQLNTYDTLVSSPHDDGR